MALGLARDHHNAGLAHEIGGIIRIVLPQVAIAIGSTIYSGRASTIVVALIVGALGAFFSVKGYANGRFRG